MKYGHLVIFVRHDPAKIQWLVALALLGPCFLKKMVGTGVFVLVVCDLKRPISSDAGKPSMILT
jgi:hypothetical protein